MNLHAAFWLALFVGLTVASLRRMAWGIPLYMMTFYAFPLFWWWGKHSILSSFSRWNFFASLLFAGSVAANEERHRYELDPSAKRVVSLLLLYAIKKVGRRRTESTN